MASTADTASYRVTASERVSSLTEAFQAWRNADHKEQGALWRKYTAIRHEIVDLMVDGLRYREEHPK